jgi:hypothetical protein
MASRLIHYLIAEEISKNNQQINRDRFVYGALLPDLSLHEDGSYDKAHFGEKLSLNERKGINWHNFRKKYIHQINCDSLYLGYYSHLIMDALWFSKIADRFIRIHPHPERKIYYQKSYDDYRILNSLLSKEYHLQYHIPFIENTEIDEINLSLRKEFFKGLEGDITNLQIACKEDLKLYPYDVILDYIDHAKALCINELNAFAAGKEYLNPTVLYTK